MPDAIRDRLETWLADALADADRRGLSDLKPLLLALADSTAALRSADWNDGGDPPSPRCGGVGPAQQR
jgi:hypothetical protein